MFPLASFAMILLGCGTILVLCCFLWNYLCSPLQSFPGPFAARFTNLWRLQDVFKGRCDITHHKLHRMHGPAVRLGPNVLSLSDPALIGQVYGFRNPWIKSNMYNVNDVVASGVRIKNLFSHQDEQWHSTYLRPVNSLYSMTRVQDMEPNVDITIRLFLDKMRERFIKPSKPCEMSDYINFFAWDVMSQTTFSNNLGILEAGSDYRKMLQTSSKCLDYFASICQIPSLDMLLDKNPVCRLGTPSFGWATEFAVQQYQKRLVEGHPKSSSDIPDFLDRFIEIKDKNPDVVTDQTVTMYLMGNLVAGSDTTASTMCAAVYYILKNLSVHQKLQDELRGANLSVPVQWKELQGLHYLTAVMRETMRLHPGVGLICERIVGTGGLTLPDGRFVPEGTVTGMNPWVINRDPTTFGKDADSFIPERWLQAAGESDDDFACRVSRMNGAAFTFGAGRRVCLGKYLSQLESYKFIATLFTKFDMELASPNQEWKIINSWFVRQENIPVKIKSEAFL